MSQATWLSQLSRKAKRFVLDRPPLFHKVRWIWQLAILPRETARGWTHAWQTRSFTQPESIELTVRAHRFKIVVDPANGHVDKAIFAKRRWATETSEALCRLLPEGGTFVDVGANIGYFTMLASQIVGPRGHVIAFEPLPFLVAQARRSVEMNAMPNVRFVQSACGEKAGTAALFVRAHNVGASSLTAEPTGHGGAVHDVQVVTLDEALENETRVDMIKVDVEGHEYGVLRGAQRVLDKHLPIVVIEYSPSLYEQLQPGRSSELVDFLQQRGYVLCWPSGERVEDLEALTRELVLRDRQYDLLCVPAPRLAT